MQAFMEWAHTFIHTCICSTCANLTMQMYMDQRIHWSLQKVNLMTVFAVMSRNHERCEDLFSTYTWYAMQWKFPLLGKTQVLLNEMSTFLTHLPTATCVQCIKVWEMTRQPTDVGNARSKGDYKNHMCLCRNMMNYTNTCFNTPHT